VHVPDFILKDRVTSGQLPKGRPLASSYAPKAHPCRWPLAHESDRESKCYACYVRYPFYKPISAVSSWGWWLHATSARV
jgi:hypothetical protein